MTLCYKFSKEDTLAMKGIAILFMYWHHLFVKPENYESIIVNFFPFTTEFSIYIARFSKICVGLFVFLSAYGITISVRQHYRTIILNRTQMYVDVFKRYFSLMQGWVFVFLFCQGVCLLLDKRPLQIYGNDLNAVFYFVLDMLGAGRLFGTPNLLGPWWYMSLAVMIVFLMPVLLRLYEKIGLILIPLVIILPHAFGIDVTLELVRWILAIILGIVCAEEKVCEKIKEWLHKGEKWLKFLVSIVLLGMLLRFRQSNTGGGVLLHVCEGLIPAYIIVFSYAYILYIPFIRGILILLGRHSYNMFLTHALFLVGYYNIWPYAFKYAWIDLLVLVVETVLLSIIIEKAKKAVRYNQGCDKLKGWLIKRYFSEVR